MALFAMAAFRLMPSITRVVALVSTIRYSQPALDVIYEDLFMNKDKPETVKKNSIVVNKGKRVFNDAIELRGVSFRYPEQKGYTVKDVSLTIPIGQSVAFIGESGAGKTTLVDIILGLFKPEQGSILIDGIDLHRQKSLWQ